MGYIPFFATSHQEVHVDTHGAQGGGRVKSCKLPFDLNTLTAYEL